MNQNDNQGHTLKQTKDSCKGCGTAFILAVLAIIILLIFNF